jgi:hypothetical protein
MIVNKLTFYEQVGIVIPGSVLVFGLLLFFPTLQTVLTKDGVSLGDFGIFVLLSYAAGHLIAAIGNVGETLFWRFFGGMPTDWITKTNTTLLSSSQVDLVEKKLQTRLGITAKVRGLDRKVWWPISRQIYAEVAKNGKPDRIDTFNGMYGLNRGLAAATFVLACVGGAQGKSAIVLALLALAAVYYYRAHRFGVYYGRELYLQFLVLDDGKTVASEKGSGELLHGTPIDQYSAGAPAARRRE